MLVCFEGKAYGIRAGDLAFNFREPVAIAPIKVRDVKVMFSSDLLATAIFVGMEGQAPHNCPWCRGNAALFKMAAGPEKQALPPRTAATQAADCAEYRRRIAMGMRVPHFNGVQAEPLIPIDWDFLIPPWLHLILGTGNEVVKKMYVQLLQQLDGVDQAKIDNLARLEDELTECEERAIDTIVGAIDHLGPDDAAVKALGEDKGAAHMARGESTELWAPLVDALNASPRTIAAWRARYAIPPRGSRRRHGRSARTPKRRRRRSLLTRRCGSSRPRRRS